LCKMIFWGKRWCFS